MIFNKGEIWLINLPKTDGREQQGKRPAIILSGNEAKLVIILPLTSNLNASKFPYTTEILKSRTNGLEKDSLALIFQIRALDKKKLIIKLGNLEKEYISKIDEQLKEILQIKGKEITKEKLEKYFALTENALAQVKENIFPEKTEEAKEIISMTENYLSDAKHFENSNDFVNAFAALNYAHGWLDSGVRLGIFDVKDDKLFTIK